MRQQLLLRAAALLGIAVLFTGCTSQEQPGNEDAPASSEDLPAFESLDEAYAAVDKSLGCESDPAGEPIVPMSDGQLTSEQRLCAEHVQVDMYPSSDRLQQSLDMYAETTQGELQLVRGENWMVLDTTVLAADEPTSWDFEKLAEDLSGEYIVTGNS